jgi:hypothetical protein
MAERWMPVTSSSPIIEKRPALSAPIRKYGDVFLVLESGRETIGFCLELGEQTVKVAAREGPLEGFGGFLIALLEAHDLAFESGRRGEVVGVEDLALDDREIDLDLVEPTGMYRRVDENDVWPFGAQTIGAARRPRCEEPLSVIKNTRRADRYGSSRIICATRRSKGAMPVLRSQRPNSLAR